MGMMMTTTLQDPAPHLISMNGQKMKMKVRRRMTKMVRINKLIVVWFGRG
jgi:hypothetical protein